MANKQKLSAQPAFMQLTKKVETSPFRKKTSTSQARAAETII